MSIRTENTIVIYEAPAPELNNGTEHRAEINPITGNVTIRYSSMANQVALEMPIMTLVSFSEFVALLAADPVAVEIAAAQLLAAQNPGPPTPEPTEPQTMPTQP